MQAPDYMLRLRLRPWLMGKHIRVHARKPNYEGTKTYRLYEFVALA